MSLEIALMVILSIVYALVGGLAYLIIFRTAYLGKIVSKPKLCLSIVSIIWYIILVLLMIFVEVTFTLLFPVTIGSVIAMFVLIVIENRKPIDYSELA